LTFDIESYSAIVGKFEVLLPVIDGSMLVCAPGTHGLLIFY